VAAAQGGATVVNEGLEVQNAGGKGKGSKKKGAKAASTNTEPQNAGGGRGQDNRAGAVRTFAVTHKKQPPPPQAHPTSLAAHGKWAGGAFLNSPAASSLPVPAMLGGGGATVVGQHNPALLDPAIVGASQMGAPHPHAHHHVPILPQQQPPAGGGLYAGVTAGTRVVAKFGDGEWYEGVVQSRGRASAMILFAGYEHEGAYEILAQDIRAPQPMAQPHRPLPAAPAGAGGLQDPSIILLARPPPAAPLAATPGQRMLAPVAHQLFAAAAAPGAAPLRAPPPNAVHYAEQSAPATHMRVAPTHTAAPSMTEPVDLEEQSPLNFEEALPSERPFAPPKKCFSLTPSVRLFSAHAAAAAALCVSLKAYILCRHLSASSLLLPS